MFPHTSRQVSNMDFLQINEQNCNIFLWSSVLFTSILAILSTIYLKWFDTSSDEKYSTLLPSEYIELPDNMQHFQRLCHAYNMSITDEKLPEWCKQEQMTPTMILRDIVKWMAINKHPNHQHLCDVLHILSNSEDNQYEFILEEADRWFENAFWMWSNAPYRIMTEWPKYEIKRLDDKFRSESVSSAP